MRSLTLPADDPPAGGLALSDTAPSGNAAGWGWSTGGTASQPAPPRRCADRRCRDCGTGCPGRSDGARDSAVLPAPRARSRTPPGVSIESSSCSCRSRGEPSLSYSCAPSTRSVLKKLTNVRTPYQTKSVRPGNAPAVHQREHAREARQHRELPSPHAPHHGGLHHAPVVGVHRERGRMDLEPAMESRPEQTERRHDHEAKEQQEREEQRRLQREDDDQFSRACKRQVLRIRLRAVGRQAVVHLVHAHVGEGRQQQRDAEHQIPRSLEARHATACVDVSARG